MEKSANLYSSIDFIHSLWWRWISHRIWFKWLILRNESSDRKFHPSRVWKSSLSNIKRSSGNSFRQSSYTNFARQHHPFQFVIFRLSKLFSNYHSCQSNKWDCFIIYIFFFIQFSLTETFKKCVYVMKRQTFNMTKLIDKPNKMKQRTYIANANGKWTKRSTRWIRKITT